MERTSRCMSTTVISPSLSWCHRSEPTVPLAGPWAFLLSLRARANLTGEHNRQLGRRPDTVIVSAWPGPQDASRERRPLQEVEPACSEGGPGSSGSFCPSMETTGSETFLPRSAAFAFLSFRDRNLRRRGNLWLGEQGGRPALGFAAGFLSLAAFRLGKPEGGRFDEKTALRTALQKPS